MLNSTSTYPDAESIKITYHRSGIGNAYIVYFDLPGSHDLLYANGRWIGRIHAVDGVDESQIQFTDDF